MIIKPSRPAYAVRVSLVAVICLSVTAFAAGWSPTGWIGENAFVRELVRRAAPRLGLGGGQVQPLAVAVTATKAAAILNDVDADLKADPGDTIRYTVTIGNSGADPATAVHLADTPDPNTTLVGGSIVISPLALSDTYASVGNMTLTSASIGANCGANPLHSVTCLDVLNGGTLTGFGNSQVNAAAIVVNGSNTVTTTNGGTVLLNADGTFVYNPAAGFEGADVFWYTLTSPGGIAGTDNASVTINVGGANGMVWFVSSAGGGTGRQLNPISLDGFRPLNTGAGTNPAAGDTIFLFEGPHALTANVTLLGTQKLIGQDTTATLANLGAPTPQPGNTYPAVNNPTGTAVSMTSATAALTLGSGNTLAGFTIGNSTFAITGGAVGTLSVRDVIINTNGQGLIISTSGTFISDSTFTGFTSVSSGGGTNGVLLNGAAGTVNLGNGTLTGNTGIAFAANLGAASINYSGTIQNSGNRQVSITLKTAGTVALSGPIGGTGTGIILTSNTGATINFTGGIALSTGSQDAFTATGGGTVNVTGSANTLTTTTGTALNVANTTIGANDLTFRSIAAGTGAGSSGVGIRLDTTGSSGGLHVTGNVSAGSGGTIQHKTGADGSTTAGIGIYLNSTTDVQLDRMQLNDFDNFAIRGTAVQGFTMTNVVINGTNGTNDGFDEGPVSFANLTGSASVTNSSISGSVEHNLQVLNSSGTLNRLTVSGTTFGAMSTATGSDALLIESSGTAVMNVTADTNTFTSARGDHFQYSNTTSAQTGDVVFTNNTVTNAHPDVVGGGGGVRVVGGNNTGQNGNITFNVSGNSIQGARGTALAVNRLGGIGTYSGTIANNIVGATGVQGSGSLEGSGIFVLSDGSGTYTASITGNMVRQYDNDGIFMQTGGSGVVGSGTMNVTVTGNTVTEPETQVAGALATSGFHLNGGTTVGDTYQICLQLSGNTLAGSGQDTIPAGSAFGDFRLRQRQLTTVRLPGYAGGATNDAAVVTFIEGQNPGGESGVASNSSSGGGFVGGAACSTPPLLLAEGGVEAATNTAAVASPRTSDARAIDAPTRLLATALTQAQVDVIVAAAIQRWSFAGLTEEQLAILRGIRFDISDLTTFRLGETDGNFIRLGRTAQGRAWFVDSDPRRDTTFPRAVSATRMYTDPWLGPAGHVDLLTAILHEMGHRLRLNDSYLQTDVDNLMYGYLTVGERRLPANGQAVVTQASRRFLFAPHLFSSSRMRVTPPADSTRASHDTSDAWPDGSRAKPASHTSSDETIPTRIRVLASKLLEFARDSIVYGLSAPLQAQGSSVDVDVTPTLPNGKTVRVVFDVTVNAPPVVQYSNFATVTGSNFGAVTTNTVNTPGDRFTTTTALVSSLNPADQGTAVTFTATITPTLGSVTPDGTVQFTDNGSNIGSAISCAPAPSNTCAAQVTTSSLAAGTRSIVASYLGGTNHAPSTSNTVSQVIVACVTNPIVTTNADGGAGSFRQALLDACTNSTITFNMASVVSPIGLTSAELSPTRNNVTISGPGANLLTVQRTSGTFRIFRVPSGMTTTISGLTLANGIASGVFPANAGGGVLNDHGTLILTSSTISGNAAGLGGGVYTNGDTTSATTTIVNSTLSTNSATVDGGALYSKGVGGGTATLALTNTTISGNTTNGSGGGIYNEGNTSLSAPLTVTNGTITNNRADNDTNATGTGGGLTNVTATITLRNTIVARNFIGGAGSTADDIVGALDTGTSFNNLIGDGTNMTGVTQGSNGNQVGTAGSPIDPKLGPLANNGGTTLTHALLLGSPAIEAGDNTFVVAPPFLNTSPITDQRGAGFARRRDAADADTTQTVDIGALEADPTIEDIADKTTNEDTPLPVVFNVGDAATAFDSIAATSSNTTLVPNAPANLAFTGSGSTRTLTITPALDQSGTTTITVTVTKTIAGTPLTASDTFVLDVTAANDPPTLNAIPDPAAILEDAALQTVNLAGISAGSGESQVLTVTATSNNQALIPNPTVSYTSPGATGSLSYTPVANAFGSAVITVTVMDDGSGTNTVARTFTVVVNPVADTPSVTNATTNEDTQTTSGLVISRNVVDGAEVTHVKITGIANGTLFQTDGTTPIANGAFITFAEANAGLRFTPAANFFGSGSFTVQASVSAVDAGLGGSTATATITVDPVADTPSVTNATTNEDTQTSSGLVISRHAADGTEVTHFKITAITNGTLFQNDGTTPITAGSFITFAQGNAGLKFTPAAHFFGSGSFAAQASVSAADAGLGGSTATATITVNAVADTPSVTNATTPVNVQTTSGLVVSRNPADGVEVTHVKVTGISDGSLFKNDGTTPIANGAFITVAEGNAGLRFTPANNSVATGHFTIQASVSNADAGLGGGTATADIIVNRPPPTISSIGNRTTPRNTPLTVTFTVGDSVDVTAVVVTATSSNLTLAPNANLVPGGTAAARSLTITPAPNQFGATTITVTATVGSQSATSIFTLTVPENTAPALTGLTNLTTAKNTPVTASFTVEDPDTGASSVTLSGTSSNPTLVPNANVVFGGSGASRDVTITPAADQTGWTTITVVASDGSAQSSAPFVLVVFSSAKGDVNGDGTADLLWRNKSTGQNIGYLLDGTTIASSGFLPTIADTNWQIKGAGDVDGDGKSDVVWRNTANGQNIAWLMNGLTVNAAAFLPTIADTNWEIKGSGDFENNGKADVIWRNKANGQNIAWLMNATSVSVAAFLPTVADTNWDIVGVGDLDGDSRADVLLRNKVTGQNIAWLMNGASVAFATFLPTIADTNWEIVGAGELDGDGKADVIWRHKTTGQNVAWLMHGTTVFSSAFFATVADTNWVIKSIGDRDADGRVDLAWHNKATGEGMIWLLDGLAIKATAALPTIVDLNWEAVGP